MSRKNKLIYGISLVFCMFTMFSVCNGMDVSEIAVVSTGINSYVIYPDQKASGEFEFAFANTNVTPTLSYSYSSIDANGLHVIAIDSTIYEQYFNGKPTTYLYIREGINVSQPIVVDLTKSIQLSQINSLSNLSKRIPTETDKVTIYYEEDEMLKTLTTGRVLLSNIDGTTYSYALQKVEDETTAQTIYNKYLQVGALKESDYTYIKLKTLNDMYKEYAQAISSIAWLDVTQNTINQPETALDGDIYLLWLRASNGNTVTYDLKIMNCVKNIEQGEQLIIEEVKVEKLIKLPVTFDDVSLIIVLSIGTVILAVLIVIKIHIQKKISNIKE